MIEGLTSISLTLLDLDRFYLSKWGLIFKIMN